MYAFVDEQLARGRQAYVVYPLVSESEKVDLLSATEEFERLRHDVKTLGHLRRAGYRVRPVREEMRANLLRVLASGGRILPGIIGYENTVTD